MKRVTLYSSVDGLLISSNKSSFIFGDSVGLHLEESGSTNSSIIIVTHRRTYIVADKEIFLIVATSEEVKQARISSIADRFQDHVVALLNRNESDIFHGLHEGKSASVCLSCLLMQMLIKRMLVIEVVACPELHGKAPSNQILWKTSPDEGTI